MTQKEKYLNALYPIRELLGINENTKKVRCPSPDHPDRNPSAIVKNNNVYCWSCQRFYNVSDLIEFDNLDIDLMYEELKDMYGDTLKEEYEQVNQDTEKRQKKKQYKPVKMDGMSMTEHMKKFFSQN